MTLQNTITTLPALRELFPPVNPRSALKELPQLDKHAQHFITLSPFLMLSSYGADGRADASPRGGEAGFVKTVDANTLLIADSPGNNRLDSLENIIATGQVGLLFIVPGMDETLRVNGTAVLSTDVSDLKRCEDSRRVPKLVIRVTVNACYLHCAKALMRSDLWNADKHIDRNLLPSMGEMLNDQVGSKMGGVNIVETQAQMLERYRQTL
jgi:PPOX class probable FMN-dependent enzyme